MRVHHNRPNCHRQPALPARLAAAVVWAATIACVTLAPNLALAQQAPTTSNQKAAEPSDAKTAEAPSHDDDYFFSEAHRRHLYEESRLSVSTAVWRNLVLPGLGNIYAEQYFYAGIAFSLLVFAAVFVGYGLVTDQSEFLWSGAASAGVAYIGSVATSIYGVRDYNLKLREGLKIEHTDASPFVMPRAPSVSVTWHF